MSLSKKLNLNFENIGDLETVILRSVLIATRGNIELTSSLLHISENLINSYIKDFDLEIGNYRFLSNKVSPSRKPIDHFKSYLDNIDVPEQHKIMFKGMSDKGWIHHSLYGMEILEKRSVSNLKSARIIVDYNGPLNVLCLEVFDSNGNQLKHKTVFQNYSKDEDLKMLRQIKIMHAELEKYFTDKIDVKERRQSVVDSNIPSALIVNLRRYYKQGIIDYNDFWNIIEVIEEGQLTEDNFSLKLVPPKIRYANHKPIPSCQNLEVIYSF